MAPVLILQFMADDAPAYLGTWLRRQGIDADVRLAAGGPAFPDRVDGYRALALLGGSMSVNDSFGYLRTAERLIDQAMARNVPVLGHCLGGQLMARTLGAKVSASPSPEIGWQRIECAEVVERTQWFGPEPMQHVFHWHYEAFDLPAGAASWRPAPRARTRHLPSARIWRCSSMWRSTTPRCGFGCRRAKPRTWKRSATMRACTASSACATTPCGT